MDTSYKLRTFSLERLSNKVSTKKNIYRSSWKLEVDRIDCQGGEHELEVEVRVGREE